MSDAVLLSLSVDRGDRRPLFQQIYEEVRAWILAGKLKPNAKLPPSRKLAAELGLSRSTISAAYDQLICEGYAIGRRGAGIHVCDVPDAILQSADAGIRSKPEAYPSPRTSVRPFQSGAPDLASFPYANWAKAVARTARNAPLSLVVGEDPFGDKALRAAIADHLADWRGFAPAPEQIIVTAGAAGALEIALRTLTEPGETIALENPGYLPMRLTARARGLAIEYLPVDDGGAQPAALGALTGKPGMIVLTPSHQFPLGGAMPYERRHAFIDWANRTDAFVVEDDFDSEFRYAGRPIAALASIGAGDRVLYVGSFSKIFTASLRLGYLVVPSGLVSAFRKSLDTIGTGASILPQRPLAEFIRSGEFHRHIRRMRRLYALRRKAFFEAVDAILQDRVSYRDHQAGMTVLLRLRDDLDDRLVAERAADRGLALEPASSFYAGAPKISGLLAGFSAFDPEDMTKGMHSLREVIETSLA
ncbi:MAG: PLP-dependent aminotransferase family protein [Pseudomonadota bacterium]